MIQKIHELYRTARPWRNSVSVYKNIFTTDKNELVVLCTTSSGAVVYWFSMDGFLMYTIPIEKENVPNPFAEEKAETFFH